MSLSKVISSLEISIFSTMILILIPQSSISTTASSTTATTVNDVVQFDGAASVEFIAAEGLNQRLENARFRETTPDFTDLYMIHTQDKGREITIYCSATHCYKSLKKNYPA